MKKLLLSILAVLAILIANAQTPDANGILYVKKGATGTGDGSSWANAFTDLGPALSATSVLNSSSRPVKEVWIAAGTFYPTESIDVASGDNRNKAFPLQRYVGIYGGFAGTETSLAQRNLSASHTTILSGDLGVAGNTADNAYHVVVGAGALGSAILDGVTITGGAATGSGFTTYNGYALYPNWGGGICLSGSASPAINNVVIKDNTSSSFGGGVYAFNNCKPTFNNVVFSGNTATSGGGFAGNSSGTVSFQNCSFANNTASYGGGVYCNSSVSSTFTDVQMTGNTGTLLGGAIYVSSSSPVTGVRMQIRGNFGATGGGIYSTTGVCTLTDVLIAGNAANGNGGGIYITGASYQCTNVTIAGNKAFAGGAIYCSSGSGTIYNSVMSTNSSGVEGLNSFYALKYSLLQGASFPNPEDNIDGNVSAGFANALPYSQAPFAGGAYALTAGSALVNKGSNALYSGLNSASIDLNSAARVSNYSNGGTIDIGAYESQQTAQSINASNISKTYGAADFAPGFTATSGLAVSYVSADNAIAEAYQDAADGNKWKVAVKKAGSVQITASQAGNATYADAVATFTLDIAKAILLVNAKNLTKFYDGTAFTGGKGVSYIGFVNNEDSTQVLTGTLTYGGTSQGAVDAGAYAITPGGLNAANYTISYSSGSLTIKLATNANGVLFVKKGSTGSGSSWADATGELATALRSAAATNAVAAGTVKQIWVAKGTYYPKYPANNVTGGTATSTDRINAFVLVKDVKIYGGFAGTETDITARDFTSTANASILSGDLGTAGDNSDNVYHVVMSAGNMGSALISGFTVTEGNAGATSGSISVNGYSFGMGYGGGITIGGTTVLQMEDMTFSNNTGFYGGAISINGSNASDVARVGLSRVNILNNTSLNLGGAMYLAFSTVDIDSANVSFNTCTGNYGGGMFVSYSSIVNANRLHVNDNSATGSSAVGGGIYVSNSSSVNMTNSELLRDTATTSGALLYENSTTAQVFKNVKMSGGYGGTGSAVIYCSPNTNLTFINTLITGNKGTAVYMGSGTHNFINTTISGNGTGIYPFGGTVNIQNSIIYGNTTAGIQSGSATVNIKYSTIQGATDDAVNYITSANPLFKSPSVQVAPFTDGDYSLQSGSPAKNAGNDALYTAVAGYPTTDLSGTTRFNGTIDQGPYEASLLSSQTITPLADTMAAYGDVFTRAFSASSGLTVALSSADNSIAEVYQDAADGNKWKIKAKKVGTVIITMSQSGNASYAPAPNTAFTLTVNAAPLTITAKDASKVYDGIAYSGGNGVTYSGFVNGDDSTAALTGTVTYGGTSQGAENVNVYVITPAGLSAANYAITYVNGALTITKAALTITATNASKIYDAVAYSGGNGVNYSGFLGSDNATGSVTGTLSYGGTSQGALAASTYTIIPSGLTSANYTLTYANGTLTINKAALTVTANNANKTYDAIAYSGGNGISYSGFVGSDNATGSVTGTLSYGGTSQGALAANTYTIIPSGLASANYTLTYANGTLTINKAALTVTANNASKTYDAVAYSGGNGVSYNGFVGSDNAAGSVTGTVSYGGTSQGALAANTYTIIPSGLTSVNYTISYANGTLTIDKAGLTVMANNASKTYDAVAYSGGNGVSYSGFVGSDNVANSITGTVSYSGTSQDALAANTYTIIPSGLTSANYTLTYANGTLTINKAALTVTANNANKTYDAVAYSGGNGVSYSGFVGSDNVANNITGTVSYSGTSQGALAANTYTIIPSGLSSSNYTLTYANGTLTINKAALTVTANNASKTYDAVAYTGGNGVSYNGFVGSDNATGSVTGTISYGGTSQSAVAANTYTIIPSGLASANYTLAYANGTLTINKAVLTITANNASKIYDAVAYSGGNGVNYSGFLGSDNATGSVTGTLSYSGTSQSAIAANTYTIIPSGLTSANYTITYANGTLTINKAALTVTANNASKTYDAVAYSGGNGISYSGFVASDNVANSITGTVSYSGTSQGALAANTYTIIPSGLTSANYTITYTNGTLTINKAALTITASNASKTYDAVAYSGGNGVSYSGFVGSDNATGSVTGTISYGGTSQSAIAANTYTIIPSGLTSANYTITYANGTLTINKAALTITANNANKTYDAVAYSGGNGIIYSGFVGSDNATGSVTGTVSYGGTSQGALAANTYTIIPSGLSAANYTITYTNGTLTINKAALTVTANNANKTYDAVAYSGGNGISYSGFVGSDNATGSVSGTISYGGTSQGALSANTYTIIPSGLTSANYSISYVGASLTINKAILTVTANHSVMCQGSALPTFGVSYTGFKLSDNENSLSTKPTVSTTANANSATGNYLLVPNGGVATNYSFAYTNGQLTINALPVVVIVSDLGLSISKGATVKLTANGGTSYSWSNANGIISGQNTAVLNIRPSQTTTYTITATNASGCSQSSSITIEVKEDFQLISGTNILTPNGDGRNDYLLVRNIDMYPNNEIKVFDIAGRMVYSKKSYNNTWDGTFNGSPLAKGTYYYIIDFGDGKIKKKGFVSIVRD